METSTLQPQIEPNCIVWRFKNKSRYTIYLEFYSQDRDVVWPGEGKVYILDDREEHIFRTCGRKGEKICFGAWRDDGYYWGVGRDNEHRCRRCCYECRGIDTGLVVFS